MDGHVRGVMFNLLEQFVLESWGADAYEGIVDRCGPASDGPFVSVLEYPDGVFFTQVEATAGQLGTSLSRTLEAFGRWCAPVLVSRYPGAVDGHRDAHACILALPQFLHLEIRKLAPETGPPPLKCDGEAPQASVTFVAARGLCALVRGLLHGLAKHFGEAVAFEHDTCNARGAAVCRLSLALSMPERAAS